MQLNNLRPASGSTKTKKRVGRGGGSGWGKTCGTGHKGQKSRSGGKIKPGFEGGQMPLQRRLPKYGFSSRVGRNTAQIRTAELNQVDGDIVNLESLRNAGLITASVKRVKVMLSGDVTRKLIVNGIRVSKGAKEAIEDAGGKVDETTAVGKADAVAKKKPGKIAEVVKDVPAEAESSEESKVEPASDESKVEPASDES